MIEVERVGEGRDCKYCSRTYGTLGCCSTVSNKWVYSCEEGHREYEKTHKHMTIPEAIGRLESFIDTFNICKEHDNALVAVSISKEDIQAFTMAIKALEQQPCEDAVSRQAVHDLIAELLSDYLHDEDREKIEELDVKIEDLEPVTPKEKSEYEHDHEVVKAYNDGQAFILDKIKAEVEEIKLGVDLDIGNEMIYNNAIKDVLEIIDKYRGDTDGKDSN